MPRKAYGIAKRKAHANAYRKVVRRTYAYCGASLKELVATMGEPPYGYLLSPSGRLRQRRRSALALAPLLACLLQRNYVNAQRVAKATQLSRREQGAR